MAKIRKFRYFTMGGSLNSVRDVCRNELGKKGTAFGFTDTGWIVGTGMTILTPRGRRDVVWSIDVPGDDLAPTPADALAKLKEMSMTEPAPQEPAE